jgi:hypothetical protein
VTIACGRADRRGGRGNDGDWASAAAVLDRAAARPDAPAVDVFLLALARHHLGRVDEARSDCHRALERPRTDLDDDETHDLALEALLTIRSLSLGAAESRLRDAALPADPFAPRRDRAAPASPRPSSTPSCWRRR